MRKQKLLIVDSFSGGKLFAEIASKEFGCENIHLLSNPNLPDYYQKTFDPAYFSDILVWEDSNREAVLNKLRTLEISAVVAGTETGVEVADQVGAALGLKGNGLTKSKARRSKSLMHEFAGRDGVRVPVQKLTGNLSEALIFAKNFLTFPLVIKPDASAGSDGFTIIDHIESFEPSFKKLHSTQNRLGIPNSRLLIQEFIQGEEFAVNTVSSNGEHFVTHIWHYHKKTVGPNKIYDWEEYVDPVSELGRTLSKFVFRTLDSLDIKYGAAHTEVMIDHNGPILIETASRVDGMCNPRLDNVALGVNQINLSLRSLLSPDSLVDFFEDNFRIKGHLANVSLISNAKSENPIKKIHTDRLERLKSFKFVRWFTDIGDYLKVTTDIFTSPGFVYLHSENKDQLYQDYRKIRELESSGLLFEE